MRFHGPRGGRFIETRSGRFHGPQWPSQKYAQTPTIGDADAEPRQLRSDRRHQLRLGTGGLSLTVASSVTLPTVPFKAIVTAAGEASNQTNSEIINVTAASTSGGTTTLTIERAAEGPMAARNITSGDQFYAWITVGVLDALGNINNANGAIGVPWKQATCTVWEGSTALETASTADLEAGMPLEGNWVGPNAAVDEIVSATLVKMTRPADHRYGRTPCVTTNGSNEVTVGEPSGTEGLARWLGV